MRRRKYIPPTTEANIRLRLIRALREVSQVDVARASGLHPMRMLRIENALAEPTDDEREAIAAALNVDAAVLWPRDDEDRQKAGEFIASAVA